MSHIFKAKNISCRKNTRSEVEKSRRVETVRLIEFSDRRKKIRKDHMVESKMRTIETFQKYENTLQERKEAMQKFSSE